MRIFEKEELKILGPFYLERFLANLLFFLPAFWIIELNRTITLTQIGIIFSINAVLSFLLEIQTGAFADLYGRKASTMLGYFLSGVAFLFLFFFKSFLGILLFMSLLSVAGPFISGAKESCVVDKLKAKKKNNLIKNFFLKEQAIVGIS